MLDIAARVCGHCCRNRSWSRRQLFILATGLSEAGYQGRFIFNLFGEKDAKAILNLVGERFVVVMEKRTVIGDKGPSSE